MGLNISILDKWTAQNLHYQGFGTNWLLAALVLMWIFALSRSLLHSNGGAGKGEVEL